jgi:hypothetical protein
MTLNDTLSTTITIHRHYDILLLKLADSDPCTLLPISKRDITSSLPDLVAPGRPIRSYRLVVVDGIETPSSVGATTNGSSNLIISNNSGKLLNLDIKDINDLKSMDPPWA